ncbi:Eco57I restriction-modification methylase domain-containing protein [Kocuria sp. CPCC 205263]|uniref:Eco57I restriction-modification methylase domain-containing protein n=1 Tax=Kocuria sp. CPCC 205263 TaxID=3073555 RepID=UPI0034D4725D
MNKKFDVVIGNPPYQEEAGGTATHGRPIYHLFMDAAYEVGEKAVLITPARFLFNAGYTPKAWNEKMLADPHLTVPHYVPNSDELFPGTDIKGGIAVTYRDEDFEGEPVGTFTKYPELNTILHKVVESHEESIALKITSSRSYRYTAEMHNDHPQASSTMSSGEKFKINTRTFQQLSYLYHSEAPGGNEGYVRVYGLAGRGRAYRWIRSEYLTGPKSFGAHKVVLPAANGSGELGEVLSTPIVVGPQVAVTQTFITIGCFDDQATAEACLKYIKSKFARALLGVLKITQHNPAKVWKYVPLQDFTSGSDIDWSKPIPQIDQQLFAKYGLDVDEIAFIEAQVRPME